MDTHNFSLYFLLICLWAGFDRQYSADYPLVIEWGLWITSFPSTFVMFSVWINNLIITLILFFISPFPFFPVFFFFLFQALFQNKQSFLSDPSIGFWGDPHQAHHPDGVVGGVMEWWIDGRSVPYRLPLTPRALRPCSLWSWVISVCLHWVSSHVLTLYQPFDLTVSTKKTWAYLQIQQKEVKSKGDINSSYTAAKANLRDVKGLTFRLYSIIIIHPSATLFC